MITGEAVQIEESRSHLRNDLAAAVYQPAASHYMSVHIALDSHICWCKLHHENYIAVLELNLVGAVLHHGPMKVSHVRGRFPMVTPFMV
jgi:hypothetical protein